VCLSNLYNLKKEFIILVLVLKKSKPCFFGLKMSSKSVPTVPPTVPHPPPLPSSTLPWTLADEEALIKRENAITHLQFCIVITHLQLCIARRDQCEIDLITFRRKYSEAGFTAGIILCILVAILSAWTLRVLADVGVAHGLYSYHDLMLRAFGPFGYYFVNIFQAIFAFLGNLGHVPHGLFMNMLVLLLDCIY
jgi:hypothetical protein